MVVFTLRVTEDPLDAMVDVGKSVVIVGELPFSKKSAVPDPSPSAGVEYVCPVTLPSFPAQFASLHSLPSPSESTNPASSTSLHPSPSESISSLLGIPSPSVSRSFPPRLRLRYRRCRHLSRRCSLSRRYQGLRIQ